MATPRLDQTGASFSSSVLKLQQEMCRLHLRSTQFGWNDRSAIPTTLKSVKQRSHRSHLLVKVEKVQQDRRDVDQSRIVHRARSRSIGKV
jgi:hypothetical protein